MKYVFKKYHEFLIHRTQTYPDLQFEEREKATFSSEYANVTLLQSKEFLVMVGDKYTTFS